MIEGLRPYAEYRDSGVPWLGTVPAHWTVRRAKYLLRLIDVRSELGTEELLTVSSARGVVPRRTATVTMFQAASYAGHKLCWPGDLVINSLWAWAGGLGVSDHHGIVSTAYGVYRVAPNAQLRPRFLHALVRSAPFHRELRVRSKGVWTSRLQLTDESFLGSSLLVPPLEEQDAIVRFLDHADRRIRRYIRAKQRLIKLLEEQKRALIHRAVTRGIDPSVRRKPSGVTWLGEIPEHWDVLPLKHFVRTGTSISYGIVQPGPHRDGGVPFLQTGNISKTELLPEGLQRTTPEIAATFPRTRLSAGDVVLGIRASIGAAHVVSAAFEGVNLSRGIARIVPGDRLLANYLVAFLQSRATTLYWELSRQGTTFNEVSIATVRQLPIVLPPVNEQREIAECVRQWCRPLAMARTRVEEQTAYIHEFRTRLIADVVTGKLDVRAAAARLPAMLDEVPEPDTLDEHESPVDGEDADLDELDPALQEA